MAVTERVRSYPGLEATTICGAFQKAVAARGSAAALRTRGDAVVYSWKEYGEQVRAMAAGLAGLGVGRGDTVATMLTNRPEFYFVDMGAVHLGAIPFGIYNTSPPDDIVHRLDNADCEVIVTQQSFLPTVRKAAEQYGRLRHIVVVDGSAEGCLTLEDVADAGSPEFDFEAAWRSVRPEDLLTIIFTSGTTGKPKGAQWTHANAIAQMRNWSELHPLPMRCISYLPFAHAGERMLGHCMPLAYGATITCCEDYRTLMADIIEVHPDFLVSVPTMWVKLMSAVKAQIAAVEDAGLRARLERTIEVGEQRVKLAQAGEPVPQALIDEHEAGLPDLRGTILSKFGLDEVEVAIIGSAPAPPDVMNFFHGCGVALIEAYGATETTFCATVAPSIEEFRMGTVGPPLPNVELRIADDGEVMIRGNQVMHSYRKQPDVTAETITPDGWLHTGDLGELDEAGHLKLIGRKKELIINLSGKNMSPTHIQGAIKGESSLIAHCVPFGDSKPYNVAVIALDPVELELWANKRGIEVPAIAEAMGVPELVAEIEAAVERGNEKLSRVEQVRRYAVVSDVWVPDSNELTPTGKVKRRSVQERYEAVLDGLYER